MDLFITAHRQNYLRVGKFCNQIIGAIVLILLVNIPCVFGKIVSGNVQLSSEETEQYLTKFSFSPSTPGRITGVIELPDDRTYFDQHQHRLQVELFNDKAWDEYRQKMTAGSLCKERSSLASFVQSIDGNQQALTYPFSKEVSVEKNAHHWYVIATDCYLEEYAASPPPFHYEIKLFNGDSHLPADEDGLLLLQEIEFIIFLIMGFILLYGAYSQEKTLGKLPRIVAMMGVAYVSQLGSVLCEVCHLWVYAGNGHGLRFRYSWFPLDFVSEILQSFSELIISFILISLSFGWTLTGTKQTHWKKNVGCFFVLFIIQLILEVMGRRYEDDFNQFHDHEHPPGYILMGLRVLLMIIFWARLSSMLRNLQSSGVTTFLQTLRFFGSLWFIAFPSLVLMSSFCVPTARHLLVTAGSIALQSTALGVLSFLFLRRSSQYWKVSSLSQMGTITGSFEGSNSYSSLANSNASSHFGTGSNYSTQSISPRRPHEQSKQQMQTGNFNLNTNNDNYRGEMNHAGNKSGGAGGMSMPKATQGWRSAPRRMARRKVALD